ncbi:(2Fe-2S)-binding protein [Halalkalibacter alkalisediminis]|uniref:Ferric siderophore reductase C-terminal domain-containing protein n=1 Tax=Halalkalibacter alkalisediminis TaxID=935616 RepID=A0ABV6NC22_9BACI|nr:(2Fe-2S)-binding protein [Halalkalibacter alkalisediminis]
MDKVVYKQLVDKHFFLSSKDQESVYYESKLIDLFETNQATLFLELYSKQMKALKPQVPATYFFSMFGITCSGFITMLTLHQVVTPLTLSTVSTQLYRNEKYQLDSMVFTLNGGDWQKGDGTVEWKRKHISSLFTSTITPLLDHLADIVDIRPRELWGQLLHGLEYGWKVALNLAETEEERRRLNQDFQWITKEASQVLFNSLKNRLDFPYIEIENPTTPGLMQRMKPTCCLYYQTVGAKAKCYTCPRMTPTERERRKKEIIAEITQ